jgi:hypothetical protein
VICRTIKYKLLRTIIIVIVFRKAERVYSNCCRYCNWKVFHQRDMNSQNFVWLLLEL